MLYIILSFFPCPRAYLSCNQQSIEGGKVQRNASHRRQRSFCVEKMLNIVQVVMWDIYRTVQFSGSVNLVLANYFFSAPKKGISYMYHGPKPDKRWHLDFQIVHRSDRPGVGNIAVHPGKTSDRHLVVSPIPLFRRSPPNHRRPSGKGNTDRVRFDR